MLFWLFSFFFAFLYPSFSPTYTFNGSEHDIYFFGFLSFDVCLLPFPPLFLFCLCSGNNKTSVKLLEEKLEMKDRERSKHYLSTF